MTTPKTIKLTKAQRSELPHLQVADEIHTSAGGYWWRKFTSRRKGTAMRDLLDGRVCNALLKKGVLVPVEGDKTLHTLNLEGVKLDD